MKKSPETLSAIVESIADGIKPLDAALLADVSKRVFFLWLRDSKERPNDPTLTVDWFGEPMPFATAVHAARQAAARGATPPSAAANVVHVMHHHEVRFVFGPADEADAEQAPAEHSPEPAPYDAELAEMLGDAVPLVPEAEPEAVPLAFDEPPSRPPRSALEADLFSRLARARAANAPGTGKDSGEPEGPPAGS